MSFPIPWKSIRSGIRLPSKALLISCMSQLGTLYNRASRLAVTAVALVLLYTFCREYFRNSYTVEPFDVPKSWGEDGLSGKVVAERILVGTNRIIQELESNKETMALAIGLREDLDNDDIEVGGFNLKSLFQYLTKITGKEDHRVRGNVTEHDSTMILTLTMANAPAVTFQDKSTNQEALLRLASEYVLQRINPYALGRYFIVQGDYDKALEEVVYIRTHFSDKYEVTALYLWGTLLRNQSRWDQALNKYNEIIRLAPHDPRGYLGKLRVASHQLQTALKSGNGTRRTVDSLHLVIDDCMKLALDGKLASDVFDTDPDIYLKNVFSWVYYEAGNVHYVLNQYPEAIELLQKGAKEMPTNPNIHNLLAYCYLRTGQNALAEQSIRQAVRLLPTNGSLWDSYAEIMAALKREDEYYYCFEQVCRQTKNKQTVSSYAKDRRWALYCSSERFKKIVRQYGLPVEDSLLTHPKQASAVFRNNTLKMAVR